MSAVRPLRALWRLFAAMAQTALGLFIVLVVFPWRAPKQREATIEAWSRSLLRRLGVALAVQGGPRAGANLLVANHVSWLDILVIHASCPRARFVSKAEVRDWPLVNRMIDSAGTLYLQRGRSRDALRVVHQIAACLQAGGTVAIFPEGTTGAGVTLMPFHANLLEAAIVTDTPIQPLAIAYADARGPRSQAVAFVGETTLWQSLWAVVSADGLRAEVTWLDAVGTRHADRRALAARLQLSVEQALRS